MNTEKIKEQARIILKAESFFQKAERISRLDAVQITVYLSAIINEREVSDSVIIEEKILLNKIKKIVVDFYSESGNKEMEKARNL